MKRLYKAQTNTMTLYYVEDWDKDLAICVNWDLNEDEEKELIAAFEADTLDETANGGEWEDIESAYGDTFRKELIS